MKKQINPVVGIVIIVIIVLIAGIFYYKATQVSGSLPPGGKPTQGKMIGGRIMPGAAGLGTSGGSK